jgi:hypothetical protein
MEARKGDLTISLNQVVVVLAIKSQLRRMTKTPVRLRTHSRQQRGFITTSIAAWLAIKKLLATPAGWRGSFPNHPFVKA